MKKILLATTTLIGAAGFFSAAAFADTPKVTVGGYANFEAGYTSDDLGNTPTSAAGVSPNGTKQQPQAFRSDTEVDFKIDGKSDAGLGYGGEVDLLADTSADVQGRGTNASKTFIYMDGSNWGRFELGSNVGADGTMKVDAATIARATGGINGDWNYFANAGAQYLAQASLPLAYGALVTPNNAVTGTVNTTPTNFTGNHTEENLDKVTYYTPRFAGFQAGVSYLPDQINRGQGTSIGGTAANPYGPNRADGYHDLSKNIWTGGLNYDNKFGDIGLTLAATGEHGNAEATGYEDLNAWNVGGKLAYMGWSVASSYGSWGKSNQIDTNSRDTSYWTAGAAYEYGPFGASVTYLNSHFGDGSVLSTTGAVAATTATSNKFTNVSVGADYKLAPGLTPYAEVSFYNENAAGTIDDNKGTVGIIGSQLNF